MQVRHKFVFYGDSADRCLEANYILFKRGGHFETWYMTERFSIECRKIKTLINYPRPITTD